MIDPANTKGTAQWREKWQADARRRSVDRGVPWPLVVKAFRTATIADGERYYIFFRDGTRAVMRTDR